jgi:3-oxoacid CoA-transferase B subunit
MAFGMIRGGHVDTAVIGALQVDRRGLVANWIVPGRPILGVGGAMDLMVGARRVIVAMSHLSSRGEPKIVPECRLPITAQRSADLIVTDRATFRVDPEGLVLESLADGTTEAWLAEHTPATYRTHESGVA